MAARLMRWRLRAEAGLRRFYAAFFWCWLLFFLLAWDTWQEPSRAVTSAALASLCGVFAAAAVECAAETRGAGAFDRRQLLSCPAAAAWFAWLRWGAEASDGTLAACGFCGACLAAGLYFLTKRAGEAAFAAVFAALWKAAGAAVLLTASLSVCVWAADTLLFDLDWRWYTIAWEGAVFAAGGPLFLSWLPEERAEAPRMLAALFRRLLFPVYLVLLAILYGYIGKIFVTGVMPEGQMNWFASLAVFGWALAWFLFPEAEGRFFRGFLRWGSVLLVPVVAVQLLCVEIRVSAYGLTASRYAGLLCTAYGLAVMVRAALGGRRGLLYGLMAALCLFAAMGPGQMYRTAERDQQWRAQTVMERAGMMRDGAIAAAAEPLSPEDRARLVSAYRYLQGESVRRGREIYTFTDQIARSEALARLAEEEARLRAAPMWRSLYAPDDQPVPVAGYDRMYEFTMAPAGAIPAGGLTFDASEAVAAFFAARPEGAQAEPMVWQADERHLLYFRRCVRADSGDGPSDTATGFVLERDG